MTTSIRYCLAALAASMLSATDRAAAALVIDRGDLSTNKLSGVMFVDEASTGGGDTTNSFSNFNVNRAFDLNQAPGAPGVGGAVTITGFGFATGGAGQAVNNTAPSVTLTFTYLGADETFGGTDDILIGSQTVDWNNGSAPAGWDGDAGASAYFVNFDSGPTALIDGLGEQFRVSIAATSGRIRLKTIANGNQFQFKTSVSGTFAAVPEPSLMFAFTAGAVAFVARRNRRR